MAINTVFKTSKHIKIEDLVNRVGGKRILNASLTYPAVKRKVAKTRIPHPDATLTIIKD